MSFRVVVLPSARAHIDALVDYILDAAKSVEDLELAVRARDALERAAESLSQTPFIYRKAGRDPFVRERIVPFGASGFVLRFRVDGETVYVEAVRSQRQDDYLG